ncbi:protein GVQW3 [Anolis sagrei]|uniref:protein GVQW3 n=1 Tax=Anolis sagrei TaxID=38937 RepID=UPI003522D079
MRRLNQAQDEGRSRAKMQRSLEQRYAIKFCVKLGKSGSETLQLLRTAYGDAVLSSAQVFRWHKAFKDGRESVEDEQRAGRPSTARTEENVSRVKAVLDRDRGLNVRLIAEKVGLPKTDVHRIMTEDLHMRKNCAKLVPKNLSDEQKNNHVLISHELLGRVSSEPDLLQRLIAGDETWVFEYDPTAEKQTSEWHTSQSTQPKTE